MQLIFRKSLSFKLCSPAGAGCVLFAILLIGVVNNSPVLAMGEIDEATSVQMVADANKAFAEGTRLRKTNPTEAHVAFCKAEQLFTSLLASGIENGKLYYNLGNANLQAGHLGHAILNYRRAENLIGNDPQLQANLRYARSLCRNQIRSSGERELVRTLFFWHYTSSINARYLLAVASFIAFWGLLALAVFFRQPGLKYAAVIMLVLWLSTAVSVAIETIQASTSQGGVTIQNDITVRKGNGDGYDPQFKESLHEGVEFRIIDVRNDWYKIELADGNTGWIRKSQAEVI